jgi:hypothetical protein
MPFRLFRWRSNEAYLAAEFRWYGNATLNHSAAVAPKDSSDRGSVGCNAAFGAWVAADAGIAPPGRESADAAQLDPIAAR